MKKLVATTILALVMLHLGAQKVSMILPADAVISGNAFQVQYIITDPVDLQDISAPDFDSFRVVSGPHHYRGNAMVEGRLQPIENITYTLLASQTGSFHLSPLIASYRNGTAASSEAATVKVIAAPAASFRAQSSFTDAALYAPGNESDLEQLVKENMFIKTIAAPRKVYVGEPVSVLFRLYSRLQSTSEVINAPSLYGFSVMDVLNTNRSYPGVETINDKIFNTSLLRKLQLYPGQSGRLVIDEMELDNEIEFDDPVHRGKKVHISRQLSSEPLSIEVLPLPLPKPAEFSGAVGQFRIFARLATGKFHAGEQDQLVVTVSGRGNFIQFAPPQVEWPSGIDFMEPLAEDTMDKNVAPVEGSRQYSYSFTADSAGMYSIPPVVFSFFDPSTRSYHKVQSDPLSFQVMPPQKLRGNARFLPMVSEGYYSLVLILFTIALLAGSFVYLFYHGKRPVKKESVKAPDLPGKIEMISMAALSDKEACVELEKVLSQVSSHFPEMSTLQQLELRSIRSECQEMVYSSISSEGKKEELKRRALVLLRQLKG